ncbi:MAG: hypothetical protein ACRD44_04075 [Bryobacteraceae bacterium]
MMADWPAIIAWTPFARICSSWPERNYLMTQAARLREGTSTRTA